MPGRGADVLVLLDSFPALSQTFVVGETRALAEQGTGIRVEAWGRPEHANPDAAEGFDVTYAEDDSTFARLVAVCWLGARHPLRAAADLVARRRWRRDEPVLALRAIAPTARRIARGGDRHVHVHFAAAAALSALRLHRLLGVPYSVTAHAYDIFQAPANLEEKLENAAFSTTGCDYNVRHLRGLVAPGAGARIHRIVMGVDGDRFRRSHPYPGGRRVLAVGRLVEKKGFEYLIDAAAELEERSPLDGVTVVGAGPLWEELEARIRARGLTGTVDLAGRRSPAEVRALLEGADLLAMPCVVAGDGDRDSMPVAVKEALAMEVPVVASDEIGLPEVVRPEWGRLVPPRDPAALAGAIEQLLALPASERAAMGRAGREFVLRECDTRRETARLADLIEAAARPSVQVAAVAPWGRPRRR